MHSSGFAAAAAMICLLAPHGARAQMNCHVPSFMLIDGATVDAYMTVRAGKRCGLLLRSSHGPVSSVQLLVAPSRGKAAWVNSRVLYTPARGYSGQDAFTYAWNGSTAAGVPSTKAVRVHVTVTP